MNSQSLHGACPRKLWFLERGLLDSSYTKAQLRVKRRRDMQVADLLKECTEQGWVVASVHPKTNLPIGFSAPGIEVRMSAIAKMVGEGFPSGWVLVEAKAVGDALLSRCAKDGIKEGFASLYGHCVLGMGLSKMHHCAVFLSADNGDTYLEVMQSDAELFESLLELAASLSSSIAPAPNRISECGSCQAKPWCWESVPLPVSCHSCHYASLGVGGVNCGKYESVIEPEDAAAGCTEHLYNPSISAFGTFIGATILENGDNAHIYDIGGKQIINCGARAPKSGLMFTSREIEIGGVMAIADPSVQAFKEQFAGSKIISQPQQESLHEHNQSTTIR